ncbi:portal protein [Lentisphaerota bacterium WC36G]|nr:head-tail connector protein [Lentisphaerae bacterium WC36]
MSKALEQMQEKYDYLLSKRKAYDSNYSDVKKYITPDRGRYLSGDSKSDASSNLDYSQITNSRQCMASTIFVSGLQSGTTPKTTPWFEYVAPDIELMKIPRVAQWCKEINTITRKQTFASNFYDTSYNVYWELGNMGTAPMSLVDNNSGIYGSLVNCRSYTAGEYVLDLNSNLQVDTFYFIQFMTARQMVEHFGIDKVSSTVKDAYKDNNHSDTFKVIQAIEPNDERIDFNRSLTGNRAFRSVYFEADNNDSNNKGDGFLRVRGFEEFPIICPRYRTTSDDIYGTSPAFMAMPDIKMLQSLELEFLKALKKVISPPLSVNQGIHKPNIAPGAINYNTGVYNEDAIKPLFQINPDLQNMFHKIKEVEEKIKEIFHNDLFLRMSSGGAATKRMTVPEVQLLNDERIRIISPTLDKFHYEFLKPAMRRWLIINERNGLFERFPIPPELLEAGFTVDFTSSLMQAQKALESVPIERGASFFTNLAAVAPEVVKLVNWEETAREYAHSIGFRGKVLKSHEEFTSEVQAEAEQVAAVNQAAALREGAETAKVMNEAAQDNPMLENAYTNGVLM